METQFLGTPSGTPTKRRNVSGLALRTVGAGHWSLIDCGEGTQHRILHTNLSLMDLRAIFITHIHGDHRYGLPGLLASAGLLDRSAPLTIVGPPPLERFVRGVMETTQLALPYPLEFIDVVEVARTSILPDLDVRPTAMSHRVPSFAYSFTERNVGGRLDVAKLKGEGLPSGPLWGRIQRGHDVVLPDGRGLRASEYVLPPRKPRTIIVGGDNDRPELLAGEARTAEVLVHEATYTEGVLARVGPGPQHSSAKMVAQLANDAGLPNLVLTHFSPRYQGQSGGHSIAEIAEEARADYRGKLFLARDLDRYVLDRQGGLARAM